MRNAAAWRYVRSGGGGGGGNVSRCAQLLAASSLRVRLPVPGNVQRQ